MVYGDPGHRMEHALLRVKQVHTQDQGHVITQQHNTMGKPVPVLLHRQPAVHCLCVQVSVRYDTITKCYTGNFNIE